MRISEVMTKDVLSVTPDTNIRKAVGLMRKNNFKELPVIEGGQLIGLVTLYDIAMLPDYGRNLLVKSVMFKSPVLKTK